MTTPMPEYVNRTLTVYSGLMRDVHFFAKRASINSSAALLLAFIGDSRITAVEAVARGYYIGTNLSYTLRTLEQNGYISRLMGKDRRHRPIFLTPAGLKIALELREFLTLSKTRAAA